MARMASPRRRGAPVRAHPGAGKMPALRPKRGARPRLTKKKGRAFNPALEKREDVHPQS